jgi:hypothetical protein
MQNTKRLNEFLTRQMPAALEMFAADGGHQQF